MKPYLEKVSSVLSEFGTSVKGLSQEEAKKRLEADGPNKLAEGKKESLIKKFLEQLSEPMLIILMVAAVLSVGTSYLSGEPEWTDAVIILVVVGHFLLPVWDMGGMITDVYQLIYLFHMPLFVFVSGLLAKHTVDAC